MQMVSTNKRLSDKILSLILLSSFCMIGCAFFMDIDTITLFLFLNIALCILAYFVQIRTNRVMVKCSLIMIGIILLHYLLYMETLKFVDVLILISIICFVKVVSNNQLTKTNQNILFWGAVICSVLLIVNMNNPDYYNENDWLQLVYENSNTAGVVGLNLFACILLTLEERKRTILKIIAMFILLGLARVVYLTSSRSSFTAMLLLIVLYLWQKRKKIRGFFLKLFLFLPILMIPLMIAYYEVIPDEFLYLGKTLHSGREILWDEATQTIFTNFWNGENAFTSGLNVVLRLPYLCGLIGTVVLFVFLYKLIMYLNKRTSIEKYSNFALIAFGCLLFQQSFESTIVSGTYCICFLSYAVLGFAEKEGSKQ